LLINQGDFVLVLTNCPISSWRAERAKTAGYPERVAQEALGVADAELAALSSGYGLDHLHGIFRAL